MLTWTIPDRPLIDACRGFVAVAGLILAIAVPIMLWRLGSHLPRRVRRLLLVLVAADLYITLTEAQQYGRPMLVWRLPIGFVTVVGALIYLVALVAAIEDDDPIR